MKQEQKLRGAFRVLTEINIIGHLVEVSLAQALPPQMSVAGFGVLNHFIRLDIEGDSPARLARAFQVTKGAMTYTLQQLEGLGYVRVDADPQDARAKIVRMTAKGRRAREAAVARVNPGMEALISEVGADAFAAALPFLTKLRQTLDAARD